VVQICFDQQIFRLLGRGGISRCFADLIRGLPAPGLAVRLPFRCHGNIHLQGPGLIRVPIQLYQLRRRLGWADGSEIDTRIPAQVAAAGLLHATYYLGAPPRALSCPLVSTLHDMTPELWPQLAPLGRGGRWLRKREWLEASDAIVSVSASSAADLTGLVPHLAGRIRVIHHGSGFQQLPPRPCRRPPRRPFHLYVGRRGGYKNTAALFELLGRLPGQLVLAGGGPLRGDERRQLRRCGLAGRVQLVDPTDAELAWLYRHCRAVLVPSLAEGFSLPLIEALACDAPVIASDLPVHREIGGDYATLLAPSDGEAWHQVLADPAPPPRPSQLLGTAAAAELRHHFSLERMLADYRRFYRDLLGAVRS